MGKTITEKIISSHTNLHLFKQGEIINVSVDFAFANDVTGPFAIKCFEDIGKEKVFDSEKIGFVLDHFMPSKDIKSATQSKFVKEFVERYSIKNFFHSGTGGIEHSLLPEKGFIKPGGLIIGADSHTTTAGALGAFAIGVGSTDLGIVMALGKTWIKVPKTIKIIFSGKLNPWVSGKDLILYTISKIGVDGATYKVLEFSGEVIKSLSMANRFTICNMAVEAGAKTGIIEPDEKTISYLKGRCDNNYKMYKSDKDASYEKIIKYDVSNIEPQVAFPSSPENCKPISEIGDILIDQSVIGSCTNGRIEDLRIAASILKGRKAHSNVKLFIIPSTQEVYSQAIKEGLIDIFIAANAIVSPPTCGPCIGGHMGVLADGERAISTTNRNFVGRMGHPNSEVFLSNPAIAAASAIIGKIVSPEEVN